MFSLPQLPDWNALHVLVIHFPLALLMLAAPVLLGLALTVPKHSRQLAAAAGVMLILGTGFCYLALNTGEAAEELAFAQGADQDEDIAETLSKHSQLAEAATQYFTFFTAAFMAYLLVIAVRKEALPAWLNAAALFMFLCGNAVLALGLANAAHYGGRLVHEHGLLAPLEPGAGSAAAAAVGGRDDGLSKDANPEHEAELESESGPETDPADGTDDGSGRGRGGDEA